MSKLKQVRSMVQQVAEAIECVMGVNVVVADAECERVAATGEYRHLQGAKLSGCACKWVIQHGRSLVVGKPRHDPVCSDCRNREACRSEGLILYPIGNGKEVLGVIGVETCSPEAAFPLLSKSEHFLGFLHRMAELILAKVSEREILEQVAARKRELEIVTELLPEGVLCVDPNGTITMVNGAAAAILGVPRGEDLVGENLLPMLEGSALAAALQGGSGYAEHVEVFRRGSARTHILVSVTPVGREGAVQGAVLYLQDYHLAQRSGYRLVEGDVPVGFEDIITTDPGLQRLLREAARVSKTGSTVLIRGESGTGKGLLARAIHSASPRSQGPFVAINCAAIPESLLESELFGYEEGAFTGARKGGKPGRFELANGGTLFLDEIGDMPIHLQAKLLRVLETRTIERVGGVKPVDIDVRLIAATKSNLEEMVGRGEFREDLYYRLNVIPLEIPPLRERRGDILPLANHFLQRFAAAFSKRVTGFAPLAQAVLQGYDWPGNVRELQNAVEYAVNMETGSKITVESLPQRIRNAAARPAEMDILSLRDVEFRMLRKALEKYGMSVKGKEAAAKALGISRATLYRRLREFEESG